MSRRLTRYRMLRRLSAVAMMVSFSMLYFYYPPVPSHKVTDNKIIALTIDDGPDPRYSSELLAVLDKYCVKATFFMVGKNVEKFPYLVKRELALGHELGNHSYSHKRLNHLSTSQVKMEITRTNGIIYKHTGQNVNWFRPPYGAYDLSVINCARDLGLRPVMWTSTVETSKIKDPGQLARRVIDQAAPGGIILLHDSRVDRSRTISALPAIISGLQKQGYTFVTLSQLFKDRGDKQ